LVFITWENHNLTTHFQRSILLLPVCAQTKNLLAQKHKHIEHYLAREYYVSIRSL